MISSVDFVSLDVFAALRPAPDMLAISIGDNDQAAPENFGEFVAGLRLEFLDCDEVDAAVLGIPTECLFSARHLEHVLAFAREHHAEPQSYRLVVHCHLGSSRSSAVALVAHHLTKCEFPRHQDAHYANGHVLRIAAAEVGAIAAPQKAPGSEPHPYLPTQLQI